MNHTHHNHKKPVNKAILGPSLVIYAVATALTWKDIKTRPSDEIWGTKKLWYIASGANLFGSIAYWVLGRDKTVHTKIVDKVQSKIDNKLNRK